MTGVQTCALPILDDVQEFVSNITVSSGGIDESLKTPQILETTAETISPYDEKIAIL